jgi:hypothetical protein
VSAPIKVTVTDPESGEVLGERVIENDYMVVTAGNRFVEHVNAYGNGTAVVTIKRAPSPEVTS